MEPSLISPSFVKKIFSTHRCFHSFSLATFLDHWIMGYMVFGIPQFIHIWYPDADILQSTLWLFGAWTLSYIARPIGIFMTHHMIKYIPIKHYLILCLSLWSLSIVVIASLPLLKLSIPYFSLLLFIARFICNIWVAAEAMIVRCILIQLPDEHLRREKLSNYDRAKIAGYLISALSVQFLSWNCTFMTALLLSTLALLWRLNSHYLYKRPRSYPSVIRSLQSFTPYVLSCLCIGNLSFAIASTYSHQITALFQSSNIYNNYITTSFLIFDLLLLTSFKKPKNIYPHIVIPLGALCICLSAILASVIISHSSPWQFFTIRLIMIPTGVLFSLAFLSTIANNPDERNQNALQYLPFALQSWLASMLYGKYLPWFLILQAQSPTYFTQYLAISLFVLPTVIVLNRYYRSSHTP